MRQRRLMNQINVVPYIDVMLVLLVIFMVTAPMIQTGIVSLPTVGEVPQAPAEAMYLIIKEDGSYALREAGAPVVADMERHEILRRLSEALAENPAQPIVVSADKSLTYEIVMQELNALRLAGFTRVGLETQTANLQ
jgi:biopolymer transport protein TolR